jgi:hypothetical protein
MLRERRGASGPYSKVRFYGEDGTHIIGSTTNQDAELMYFSLKSELISQRFTQKRGDFVKARDNSFVGTESKV